MECTTSTGKIFGSVGFNFNDDTQQIDGEEWIWTPERLEASVFTYGQPWYSKEDMKQLYGLDYSIDSKVTSLLTDSNKENRLENIKISIDFF